jgi:hypothetical protein
MNELKKEIVSLVEKLNKSFPIEGSAEQIAANILNDLLTAMESTKNLQMLEPWFADLEQFWASSVAWCSELSKDIEKIIITYRELL